MDDIKVFPVRGEQALKYIPSLAHLRIEIFREFPYLYQGDYAYEEKYLQTYIKSSGSIIIIATDNDRVIGASTALPLKDETENCIKPFREIGYDPATIFYFGESVLQASYRGQGIGVAFFNARETHASSVGDFQYYAFCAVERAMDHPRRPKDYKPLDDFWMHRGYTKHPELVTYFSWKDLDENTESKKQMTFWLKNTK